MTAAGAPDLVGRENQLGRLKGWIADPEAAVIAILGPSGAGKSALAEAALADLGPGVLVGRGRYAGGPGGGLAPLLGALAMLVDRALDLLYEPDAGVQSLREAAGDGLAALAKAGFSGPPLGEAWAAEPGAPHPDGGAALIETAARLVRWLGGFGAPMVLFVDDWQRAPPQAVNLAAALAPELKRSGVTLLLVERGGADAVPRLQARSLMLGALAGPARARLLGRLLGDPAAGEAAAAWLGEAAPGLPFDVIETGRRLLDAGALTSGPEGWKVDPARAAAAGRSDIDAGILARVLGLPPAARRIALAAALCGGAASPEVIAQGLGVSPAEAIGEGRALEAAGLMA